MQRFGVNPRLHLDALALQVLALLSSTYIPWTEMSMRPSGVVTLLNDIVINNRKRIVECGGGVSTLYMARLLTSRGGHLFTIEEDRHWSEMLGAMLDEQGLHDQLSIIVAPMAPTELGLDKRLVFAKHARAPAARATDRVACGRRASGHGTSNPDGKVPGHALFRTQSVPRVHGGTRRHRPTGGAGCDPAMEQEHGRRFSRRFFRGGIAISTPDGLSV